ncbi:unnamed protein product [[Actinomadura] parvosata subsp. kistnae]|uniref:Polymer-forming cytoskeletal protein n=1 Tax=[Actinomadura] parvosata subsp. kistnae TaxID=1909395 RepID=A0A1U9ZUR5_9ACTN|nr:hypothetical protein [Nonomuraea sp. ATCC 55076]AQZ61682.1 hypothetical protein BKM31_09555 [Nonomuraea sp. ATCC 55076]SPL87788.1 unnamed protein product [Actinomadura parvosata subsp. kistnae]
MNECAPRLLARCLLTAMAAAWVLLLGASPAAAGCGSITYEQRQADPAPAEPEKKFPALNCDQSVPAAAAALACALGLTATGFYAWRLHSAGAAPVAPVGQAKTEVVGPGEVRVGDVDGDVVIRGGTLVGQVSGTAVMVDNATFIGKAQYVVQIGYRNDVVGDIAEGENVVQVGRRNTVLGDVAGKLVQARSVMGRILTKGRKVWPLD